METRRVKSANLTSQVAGLDTPFSSTQHFEARKLVFRKILYNIFVLNSLPFMWHFVTYFSSCTDTHGIRIQVGNFVFLY